MSEPLDDVSAVGAASPPPPESTVAGSTASGAAVTPVAPTPTAQPLASPRLVSAAFEDNVQRLVKTLVNDRRIERRWRVFFRLAWLGLALALVHRITSYSLAMRDC